MGPQEAKKMMKSCISFILDYHKTDFIAHLSREANRQISASDVDSIQTMSPYIAHTRFCEKLKLGPCNDCEKSFDVFTETCFVIRRMHRTKMASPSLFSR